MPPHGRRRPSPMLLLLAFSIFLSSAAAAVIGIDLGTEYIKAALVKPGIPLEIVLTKDSRRKEAAVIAFKPTTSASSSPKNIFPERAYGADALALSARFPGDVYSNLKPLVGLKGEKNSLIGGFNSRYPGLNVGTCTDRQSVCLRSNTFVADEEPFLIEELLAMQLQNIRANAEAFAGKGSVVKNVVITIPPYYTVEEKRVVEAAAELADLKVLGVISDGLAVGLNYATSRTFGSVSKGEKPEHHLVFDMGAGSTKATVLRFQGRDVKDVGKFTKPVQEVQVLGAGWDKSLGGDALNSLIVEDMLHRLLETPKVKSLGVGLSELKSHGRSIAKMWKDAERLRQVLSANIESQASFEGLYHEDVNFKYKLTRTQFEKMVVSFEERVKLPIVQALDMAKLELADIDSVILFGGASRTPFIQKALESIIGKVDKLRTNVNSDEAAAFGAAFKAAGLSPSFRVKEIRASEAGIMPAGISWVSGDGKEKKQKLFGPKSLAGVEKQIPFKFTEDFSFSFYQEALEGVDGTRDLPISRFTTKNLTAAANQLKEKYNCEPVDMKTSFSVRLSPLNGLPEATRGSISCEAFDTEKKAGVKDRIKGLFGGKKKGDQEILIEENPEAEPSTSSETSTSSTADSKATDSKIESKKESKKDAKAAKDSKDEKHKEPVKKTFTVYVGLKRETAGQSAITAAERIRIKDRMKAFDNSDRDRKLREEALNNLEGYTYKVRDLLEDEGFVNVSTDKARTEIEKLSSIASEWLYGDGSNAPTAEFKERLRAIQDLVTPIQNRKNEAIKRPEGITSLKNSLMQTKSFIELMKSQVEQAAAANVAAEAAAKEAADKAAKAASASPSESSTNPLDALDDEPTAPAEPSEAAEPGPEPPGLLASATPEDVEIITTAFDKVEKWLEEKTVAQEKLSPYEEPAFLFKDIQTRAEELNKILMDTLQKRMQRGQAEQKKKEKAKKEKEKAKKEKAKAKKTESSTTTEETKAEATERAKDEL